VRTFSPRKLTTLEGIIRYDHILANFSYNLGLLLMIISLLWGGYILILEYKNIDLKEREEKESTT